jgi:tripartite-type tricarboxylate transporter receptor subunit TctC
VTPIPQNHRRQLLVALAAAACGPVSGQSRTWPQGPIRILVAYPSGGLSDMVARDLAEHLSSRLRIPVLVENRPGASGTLAMAQVARSAPDGQVLCFGAATAAALLASGPSGGTATLPVAGVMRTPVLVVGTPALQADTFASMLVAARQRRGGIRWATTGTGTTGHAVLERVRRASGAPLVHIPYKGGGQQITDALGGHFEVLSTNVAPQQIEAVQAGRLRALAVGAPSRLPALPEVPTLAELGFPDANLDSLFGLFAAPNTPTAIVERIHAEVGVALRTTPLGDKLRAANNRPFLGSPAEFAEQVPREVGR